MEKIMPTELEISSCTDGGYTPLVHSGGWRVAIVNSCERLLEGKLVKCERHTATDEVFVLLSGGAKLYIGDELVPCELELGKAYNVKCGAWHCISLSEASSVLVIESDDTSSENTELHFF